MTTSEMVVNREQRLKEFDRTKKSTVYQCSGFRGAKVVVIMVTITSIMMELFYLAFGEVTTFEQDRGIERKEQLYLVFRLFVQM